MHFTLKYALTYIPAREIRLHSMMIYFFEYVDLIIPVVNLLYNYTPRNEVEGGYTGFTLLVRPSVRLSVCLSVRPSVRGSVSGW